MTSSSKHPRALIEIFKFADSFHALTVICRVCKAWYHAVSERELWLHYVISQFPNEDDLICSTVRETQIRYMEAVLRGDKLVNVDWADSTVEEYSAKKKTYKHGHMSHYPYACPSWCPVGSKYTLICGGFNLKDPGEASSKLTVFLSLRTYDILPKADMIQGRYRHALLPYGRFIYAFGGKMRDSSSACEKYNIQADNWQTIASMHEPRYSITPAVYESKVYLIGSGSGVDVFDLYTETFSLLVVSPMIESGCSAISVKGCIYILNRGDIYRWDGKSASMQLVAKIQSGIWFSPSPVCKTEDFILINTEFGVRVFNPVALAVSDISKSDWNR